MGNKSLLEMLEQEKHICMRLQSIGNMLHGLNEAAEEGRTEMERHGALIHRCVTEYEELEDHLQEVRKMLAKRIDDLAALATGGKEVAA